jgi:undecaprenyl diphosphate synthase
MRKPNHILYIPDGDRAYSQKSGQWPDYVYEKSGEKLISLMEWIHNEFDIPNLTIYALAQYNLNRNREEVGAILKGGMKFIQSLTDHPILNDIDVHFVGELDSIYQIVPNARAYIESIESRNKKRDKKTVVLSAFDSYKDFERAVRKCWQQGIMNPNYRQILNNTSITVPIDIVIRTAATKFSRLSGVFIGADQARIFSLRILAPELDRSHIQKVLTVYEAEISGLKERL